MPFPGDAQRCAVVDLGSNSVRLVVYEGLGRNPVAILNEKAVLRLGKGLQTTGDLNAEGMTQAVTVMARYHAIGRAMRAEPFEVLATAAVRDARNGPEFVEVLRRHMPGVPITILSGPEEAAYSAAGVLCGIPDAHGVLADIGGGSLELVRVDQGVSGTAQTLRLGAIRLSERANGDLVRARSIVENDLRLVPWLGDVTGRNLYLVGGAWRALARIHMVQTGYPLLMVHHYTIAREEAREFAGMVASASRRALERLPAVARRRIDDLPYAAVVLRRLVKEIMPAKIVFSASGMREGWFMQRIPAEVRRQDPLLAAARHYAQWLGRDPSLPILLLAWTDPLFGGESPQERRLREATCWMSDIGSRDHPEFRAEQAFLRVFRQPGIGLDHRDRAFLALAIALRYEVLADAPYLRPARALLDAVSASRAEVLGSALRLGYLLSAGTPELLAGTTLDLAAGRLILRIEEAAGVFAGDGVTRRLERLAQALRLTAVIEERRQTAVEK